MGYEDQQQRPPNPAESLDAGAPAKRRGKATLLGVGDGPPDSSSLVTGALSVPAPPRLPTLADNFGDDEHTNVAPRPSRAQAPSAAPPPVKSRRPMQRPTTETSSTHVLEGLVPDPRSRSNRGQRERPITEGFPAYSASNEPSPMPPQTFIARPPTVAGSAGEGLFSVPPNVGAATSGSFEAAPASAPPPRSRRFSVTDRSSLSEREPPALTPKKMAIGAGVVLGLLAVAFTGGRASAPSIGQGAFGAPRAHAALVGVPLYSRTRSASAAQRPCLMQAAPARWAPKAERSIPIELVPSSEVALAVGYGRTAEEPRGLVLDMDTGQIASTHEPAAKVEGLVRVSPLASEGQVTFASVAAEQAGLKQAIYLRSEKPMLVGVAGDSLAMAIDGSAEPKPLWKLPGAVERLQVAAFGPNAAAGFGVVYLSGERVFYGAAKLDGTVLVEPTALESQAKVGKPMLASDGREVSVVYAEGMPGDAPVRLRWARGPVAGPLTSAPFVDLPVGGPGGDAIAPDIAALPHNRWLLLWTEGREGDRALRAQTFDGRGVRLGPALRVSPETGNFGQGTVSVVGGRAAVAFLLKTDSYQLWGTVLQCR
jgi:hypothetical protein